MQSISIAGVLAAFLALGVTTASAQSDLSDEKKTIACKAFAASFGGLTIDAVGGEIGTSGHAQAWYRKDGQRWEYACKFTGDELIWAAVDNDRLGRWRTEEEIVYVFTEEEIIIKQVWGDGSVSEYSYPL